jgi:uncharacterized protein (DUF1800 family)
MFERHTPKVRKASADPSTWRSPLRNIAATALLVSTIAICAALPRLSFAQSTTDTDKDGIPDSIESLEGLNASVRDNDIFSSARLFVMQAYRLMAFREGDANGVAAYTKSLARDETSREALMAAFFTAPEIQKLVPPVLRLYKAFYLRNGDADGTFYWVNQARTTSLSQISQAFASSAEFTQRYGTTTNEQYVQLLYQNVLERAVDNAGKVYWTQQLDTKKISRGDLMLQFSESAENKAKTANSINVAMAYLLLLNRAVETDGAKFWTGKLDEGMTLPVFLSNFINASEFRARFVDDSAMAFPDAQKDAARFLTQATFGFNQAELQRVQQLGYEAWINDQVGKTYGSHVKFMQDKMALALVQDPKRKEPDDDWAYQSVWQNWISSDAQLRGRVAFALSQIVVVSNIAPNIHPWALGSYMDLLYENAFGNYRDILDKVTLHPAMGYFLDMNGNKKDDPAANRIPNENYARELMQLFTLGLYELNPDGSRKTTADGRPIEAYDEEMVRGFSKAFTGWAWAGNRANDIQDFPWPFPRNEKSFEAWTKPMDPYWQWHSTSSKKLTRGVTIPASDPADRDAITRDMKAALDNIFSHPNVGPFVSKQLIQRLVTSNPSPAYISRVVAKFENNGQGVRGDLGAVVKQILLDPDARSLTLAQNPSYGKQREPNVRLAHYLRSMGAKSKSGRNNIGEWVASIDKGLTQAPLLAPSVFNFFSPNFSKPGPIAQARLLSPEFQITNELTGIGQARFFWERAGQRGVGWGDDELKFDDAYLRTLSRRPFAFLRELELIFTNGELSRETKAAIVQAMETHESWDDHGRVRTALALLMLSPDFSIQR